MTWEIYWDFSLLSYICCKGTKNFWNIQIYIKVFLIFTNFNTHVVRKTHIKTLSVPANETNGISCGGKEERRKRGTKVQRTGQRKNAYPNQIRG